MSSLQDGPLHGLSNAATGAATKRANASQIIHVSFWKRCRATGAPYNATTSAALQGASRCALNVAETPRSAQDASKTPGQGQTRGQGLGARRAA
eukprot:306873-Chlamydomonas_euryale.AAC.1